eukprot:scaffold11079_cov92-Amphora_coffeaeformis.AAC.4
MRRGRRVPYWTTRANSRRAEPHRRAQRHRARHPPGHKNRDCGRNFRPRETATPIENLTCSSCHYPTSNRPSSCRRERQTSYIPWLA